jgi:hypothetical protein
MQVKMLDTPLEVSDVVWPFGASRQSLAGFGRLLAVPLEKSSMGGSFAFFGNGPLAPMR